MTDKTAKVISKQDSLTGKIEIWVEGKLVGTFLNLAANEALKIPFLESLRLMGYNVELVREHF